MNTSKLINRQKHVFVDAHVFDNEFQGTRTYIQELYSILIVSCPEVIFYFGAIDIKNLADIFGIHRNVKYLKYRYENRLIRLGLEIPIILFRNKIDLAHFQYITPFVKVCKQVCTIHDVLFNDFNGEFSEFYKLQKNFLYRRSARKSNFVLTVSEYSKRRIEYYFPFLKGKIQITPNGVNVRTYFSYDKNKSKNFIESKYKIRKYILYVSRIEPRKKHDLLLSAFINLKLFEKGYSLVFIGKESLENLNLKNLLNKGNAIRNYFYFESVGKDDLLHFYNGADLFVYPSIAEGFGLPPIEAAVLNTPVLCSSRTAMSDYVFFGDNLFNPSDSSEFESKLLSNLESPKKEEELSYIKRSILDNYSWENSSKKISEIIKSIQ